MVQNFAVFADRLATAKIKTTKISMGGDTLEKMMMSTFDQFSHVRPLYLCSLQPSRRSLNARLVRLYVC